MFNTECCASGAMEVEVALLLVVVVAVAGVIVAAPEKLSVLVAVVVAEPCAEIPGFMAPGAELPPETPVTKAEDDD